MSEDKDLLLKIGQISGQINLHKNKQEPSSSRYSGDPTSSSTFRPYPGTPYRAPRGRGRGRGRGAGAFAPSHKNRTLVLNNANNQDIEAATSGTETAQDSSMVNATGPAQRPTPGWIAKHDRHKQLINSSVYMKEMQVRARDLEETRILKARKRDEREKQKINRYLERYDARATRIPMTDSSNATPPEIVIEGIRFQVTNGGSRLAKLPSEDFGSQFSLGRSRLGSRILDDLNSAKTTPKNALVGGVKFHRSKHGNLYRSAVVKAKKTRGVTKISTEACERFTRTGSCSKGPLCHYQHDPSKVAICKDFLQSGTCSAGDACDLSHDPTPERVPACLHFLRGKCSNPDCRYAHVRVNPAAPVCTSFARLGFCGKGAECVERHVNECPDYANKGSCTNKKCRLPHIDRAGQIRKKTTAKQSDSTPGKEDDENKGDDEESDVSSDEDDQIGSDDVDSDSLDEEYTTFAREKEDHANGDVRELSQQRDFIHF